jgi:DNA-binding XRE family transcriptional regulator
MKKSDKNMERFIELRASGTTLAKAAQELDIAYNTAVNWEKDLLEKIEASKAIKTEELLEKYRMTKEKRIELFGERLLAIQDELAKRDLSDIPTPKLFEMMIRCTKALEAEASMPHFLTENDIEAMKAKRKYDEQMQGIF